MAAFTTFSEQALNRYLTMFDRGELIEWSPIAGGIENSNYFVTLNKDGVQTEWVLTIVETLGFDETAFFSRIVTHLHHYGLPVAAPIATLDGMTGTIFCGKPSFLFPRLSGHHLSETTTEHCTQIGVFLAQSQRALEELSLKRDNPYSVDWMRTSLKEHAHRLDAEETDLIQSQIDEYDAITARPLPRGLIHGDLFLDNALFNEAGDLSGVIDFYHACHDLLIQDLAIVINDWCLDKEGSIDPKRKHALVTGYESVRQLGNEEKQLLVPLQRVSAARFALTRLISGNPPLKDPQAMLDLAKKIR